MNLLSRFLKWLCVPFGIYLLIYGGLLFLLGLGPNGEVGLLGRLYGLFLLLFGTVNVLPNKKLAEHVGSRMLYSLLVVPYVVVAVYASMHWQLFVQDAPIILILLGFASLCPGSYMLHRRANSGGGAGHP